MAQSTRGAGRGGAGSGGDGEAPGADEPVSGSIEPIEIQEEMERSFLEYSMSVIVARALPDVRDGLKPVHRRILYSMFDNGQRPDRPHSKCAKVVGEVMGTYHPHGDSAIYEALARMVQEFSLRHPLIDGHGSFGGRGPDDGAAAMRYTECRLAPLALELMADIDEETVDMVANYDGSSLEPVVLPGRFPNLLVNGSQGIAVGMATNVPPHNMGEVIDAAIHVLHHPEATPDELMEFVKGPDFPTGAQILGRQGILDAYRTGRGSIKMRAVAEIEEGRSGDRIVISELPYQTSVEVIEQKITELVRAGDLDGISGMRNASANQQPSLIIELKRDANANVVLNNLYKQTPLQTSFGVNMLALVDGVPRTLNLAQALSYYIDHQIEVIQRRSQFRLDKARAPGPHRRGPAARHRHARCGHRHHPGVRRPARGADLADGRAVLLHRGAGHAHPRHDAGPPDPARPLRAGGGDGGPAGHHRRARGDPVGRRQAARRDRDRNDGDPRQVRQPAPQRDHARPGRDGRRGPHLRRGDRRHHDAGPATSSRWPRRPSAPRAGAGAVSRAPG